MMLRLCLLVLWISTSISETFKNSNDIFIYHLTPVLHVPVDGIDAHSLMTDLKLVIGAVDQPPLKADIDYSITAGDGELVLKLLKNKRWADTGDEEKLYPIPLMLFSATMGTTTKTKLLSKEVVLAQVIPTPFVGGNAAQIHCTQNANISILTYSTIGARKVELEFKTSLKRHIDYELTSSLPLQYFRLLLQLKEGRSWKAEDTDSNTLTVMSIDTGAGPWQVGGGKGVAVAYMECPPQEKLQTSSVKQEAAAMSVKPGEVLTVYSSSKSKTTPIAAKDIEWVVQEAPKSKSSATDSRKTFGQAIKTGGVPAKDTHSTIEVLEEYLEVEQPKVVDVVHGDQHNAHHAIDKKNSAKSGSLRKNDASPEYVLSLPSTTATKRDPQPAKSGFFTARRPLPSTFENVTVISVKGLTIYDNAPRISFQLLGVGDVPVEDIVLSLGDRERSRLTAEVDYIATKKRGSDEVVLYLLYNKQWGFMFGPSHSQALVLYSVKVVPNFNSEGSSMALAMTPNLLQSSVKLATVLTIPGVLDAKDLINPLTPELHIGVTGCVGAHKVRLVFFPQLLEGTDYVDVTSYPLTAPYNYELAVITLRLKNKRKWKQLPGALIVRAVDSGGGLVKVNGDKGEFVAIISDQVPINSTNLDRRSRL